MKKVIITLAALAASSAAVAGPSWTYVDLGYLRGSAAEVAVDLGDGAIDPTGVEKSQGYVLEGSFGFAEMWHVSGYYGSAKTKVDDNPDVEIDSFYNITGGIHPAITDSTDFVAEIGYTTWDLKDLNIKPTAYDLTVGVRSMLSDRFEIKALLAYQSGEADLDGIKDKFQIFAPTVGGQFFFTDNISVNLDYTWGDAQSGVLAAYGTGLASVADTAKFGVRWSF